jgi:hypothetical protein
MGRFIALLGFAVFASLHLAATASAQTVSGLTCSPSAIAGGSGGSTTCTVTLGGAAPASGTVVTLTSSLVELAASVPRVTVPAGATTASFTVATNPNYRRYSRLAFSVIISASANGTTRSAPLDVTAQPRPPDFSSGSQAGANTQWQGLMCGRIPPIGGSPEILYECSPASGTGFGTCTFRQECPLGCRRVPPDGGTFSDSCATGGPNAVTLSRNHVVAGDRVSASVVAEAPAGSAPAQEQGVPGVIDPNFNAAVFPHNGIPFPDGATSVPFDVATSNVPAIQFVDVVTFWFNDAIPPFLVTNGRGGHAWLVMVPQDPAPPVAIPTLGDFKITGSNPVTGGQRTIGQVDLSGLSRAGGPSITVSSSHPDIVGTTTVEAPQTDRVFGFQVQIPTQAPATETDVTVTATDGRHTFSDVLTVRAAAPPPVLSGVSVNPTSVVGGNPSTGTVTLSGPRSSATVVTLSTPAPASVATMPSSVTVPAGATSATFQITTRPVTSTFNMNVFADHPGSPGRQALLLIQPGSSSTPPPGGGTPPAPSSVTLTVTATGRSGERIVSSPTGINVPVGSTGSSSFAPNTSVTLRVSNGREAVWSGACSSGGARRRSCTFTITGNASVTGNVR